MGQYRDAAISHITRSRPLFALRCRNTTLLIRILVILLILALLHGQHLNTVYRHELAAKYSATNFETPDSLLWRTKTTDPQLSQHFLSNRQHWKVLGAGWEGSAFIFNNSVIKTFTPGRSPFRNCAPGHPSERWPTEIPASLEFGGIWRPDGDYPVTASNVSIPGFLPVKAYFVDAFSPTKPSEWYLVTPLVPGGDLRKLATRLREQFFLSFRSVDALYRPAFHQILQTLGSLHERGFCHDDVKPANIFVQSDTNWVLGDLGNVRHTCHPYHASRLWIQDNHQLADCRANDVLRALKSYLHFVKASSTDPAEFDAAFFDTKEPLSRLFWSTLEDPSSITASGLRHSSEAPDFMPPARGGLNYRHRPQASLFRRRALSDRVDAALETKFSERAARWAALIWIFGVPVEKC